IAPAVLYAIAAPTMRRANLRFVSRTVPYRDPYDFFIKPWKCGDTGQRRYVNEVYAQLPPGSVLFTSYTMQFMLEYGQLVDRLRPDVTLISDVGDLANELEAESSGPARWKRPVYASDADAKDFPVVLREECSPEQEGLLWKLDPPHDREAFLSGIG